ncbi:hypothetical protein NAF17_11545 [Mucilaginibacter sp. RB4R14]|uniref:hypothetical protein n=1 Tax=Mucilaginibacter aurantiaciroseus TaxID=2949308 RepID=UPI00208FFF68|nr:hypothetical protein [Mucilaginibacter aurantiaciroseus]MCO5936171.1 hypothetical protein [Mucilaginibacter aurantiaciroseus]
MAVIVIYYTITYLKRNYDHEKRPVADKANSISQQNKHISEQNKELARINSEKIQADVHHSVWSKA